MSAVHEDRYEESEYGLSFYLSSFSDYESNKTNTSQSFKNNIPTIELNMQQSYEVTLSNLHSPQNVYTLTKEDPESSFTYFVGISQFDKSSGLWEVITDHEQIKSQHFKSYLENKNMYMNDLNRKLFSVQLDKNLMGVLESGGFNSDPLISRFIENFKDALTIKHCSEKEFICMNAVYTLLKSHKLQHKHLKGEYISDTNTFKFITGNAKPHELFKNFKILYEHSKTNDDPAAVKKNYRMVMDLFTYLYQIDENANIFVDAVSTIKPYKFGNVLNKYVESMNENNKFPKNIDNSAFTGANTYDILSEQEKNKIDRLQRPVLTLYVKMGRRMAKFMSSETSDTVTTLTYCGKPYISPFVNNKAFYLNCNRLSVSSIFVYCDIIKPNRIGEKRQQLLGIVSVGDTVTKSNSMTTFKPLAKNMIDSVSVVLTDPYGNPLAFEPGSFTCLEIYIRPR